MRGKGYLLIAFAVTWLAIFLIIPTADFDIELWKLIVSASVGGMFACLLVLHGEAVVEDIVKVVILLILAGVLWGKAPKLGYVFVSVLVSGVIGAVINQVSQYSANKRVR